MMLNRSAVVVTPAHPFLNWLHSIDPASRDMKLEDFGEEPSIYLLPEADTERDAMFHLRRLCPQIFDEQLYGWYRDRDAWPPKRGWPEFKRWFTYTRHSILIDLCQMPLERR